MAAEKEQQRKRAFIYCRTSDDAEEAEESKKVSIETQEESGKVLAKRHGYAVIPASSKTVAFIDRNRSGRLYPTGFEIADQEVETYCDECGYSSRSRTRDSLGELLRRIKEVDVIIVRRADRLMRPLPLSKLDVHVLTILKAHNVQIHSHDDNIINPNNPEHIFVFKLTSTIHSQSVADRRDETKIGVRRVRDDGMLYFPPSFYGFRSAGYQAVERIDAEIKIVKRIFAEFLDGKKLKAIARDFNSTAVPVPTLKCKGKRKDGKGFWLDSTIRTILKRPQYAGFQFKSNGTDEVQVKAFHPPVVPYETFRRVQDIFTDRPKGHVGNTKEAHALCGICHCGYCGYKLYTTATYMKCNGTKYKVESLRCITPSKTTDKTQCEGVQVRERFPKGLTRRNGKAYTNGLEDCLFPLIYKGYINHLIAKTKRVGLDDEIGECLKALERNESHKKMLGQKLGDNRLDDKTFDLLIKDAIEAGTKIEIKLATLQKEATSIDRADVPSKLYADFASHKLPNELKRQLFHHVIDRVDVWHDRIEVALKGGAQFILKRIRRGKTFDLPSWRIVEINGDSIKTSDSLDGVPRAKYRHTPIKEDTKIDVVYEYDNADSLTKLYGDENLIVMAEGKQKHDSPTDAAPGGDLAPSIPTTA